MKEKTSQEEIDKREAINKLCHVIDSNNLKCTWQATTPEEALEEAFHQPQIIALYGNLSLDTTLEEMADKMEVIDFANEVLARKETKSPQKDVLYANNIKGYSEHIAYLRNRPTDSEEHYAALVYDWICNGMEPTIKWVAPVLVQKRITDWDFEMKQNIVRYAVSNALTFRALLERVITGYVLAHKIGELKSGKSFKAMLKPSVTEQQKQGEFSQSTQEKQEPFEENKRDSTNYQSCKKVPATLQELFPNQEAKVSIIKAAIKDLQITNLLSERQITGFIDGCKSADAFPQIATTTLFKIIFFETGKTVQQNSKPRYDKHPYDDYLKKTKEYFGIK